MVTEFPVRELNVAAVPLLIARLGASKKQDCAARWIEYEQDAHGVSFELNAKLFHLLNIFSSMILQIEHIPQV